LQNASGTLAFTSDIPSVAGVYLPLAGGTLTGALNGTSASFSGDATVSSSNSTGIFTIGNRSGNNAGIFKFASSTTATNWIISNNAFTTNALQFTPSTAGGGDTYTTPALTLDSTGNVGIGTTSPIAQLQIGNFSNPFADIQLASTTAGYSSILFGDGATGVDSYRGYIQYQHNGDYMILATASAERMRITSGGFLKLREATTSTSDVHILRADTLTDAVCQVNNANASQTSDGLFTVVASRNTTNNTFFAYGYYNAGAGAFKFRVADSGDVTNTNNSYGSISDVKLKENIRDATPKLDDLLKVKVKNYNFIGSQEKQLGVIAQELEEVFPAMVDESEDFEEVEVHQLDEEGNELLNEEGEVVTTKQRVSKGTTTKSVKYSVFVPMLIKAIQEQQEQIQELKTEIDSLKNQIK
jgi:hypothetical protein